MTQTIPEASPRYEQLLEELTAPDTTGRGKNMVRLEMVDCYLEKIPEQTLVSWVQDPEVTSIILLRLSVAKVAPAVLKALMMRACGVLRKEEGEVVIDDINNAAIILRNVAANSAMTSESLAWLMEFAETINKQKVFFPLIASNPNLSAEMQGRIYEYAIAVSTQEGDCALLEILSKNPNLTKEIAEKLLGYEKGKLTAVTRRYPTAINRTDELMMQVIKDVVREGHDEYADMLLAAVEGGREKIGDAWLRDIKKWAFRTLANDKGAQRFRCGLDMKYICSKLVSLLGDGDVKGVATDTRRGVARVARL